MFFFTDTYKHNIAHIWHEFVQNNTPIIQNEETIRKIIYDSWIRSKNYNINPNNVLDQKLSARELALVLKENEELVLAATPYMENLYSFTKGLNFLITLTDSNARVIHLLGEDLLINERAKASRLTLGSLRKEQYAGTNAMGTCLYLGIPLQIYGEEHYVRSNHTFACTAAPIRDENNKIIGCLNFTGPKEHMEHITFGIVVSAVSGIEKGIQIRTTNKRLALVNSQLTTTLQSISSGIIMVNNEGIITQFNSLAENLLRVIPNQLIGSKLADFVDTSNAENPFMNLGRNISNKEIFFLSTSGFNINLSMSTTEIFDDEGLKIGTVILLDELKKIHRLASQLSGFTAKYTFDSIIGDSPAITFVKDMGNFASQNEVNVLILGESGTGKELVAQAIHNASSRAAGPFIAINCGSIPRGLIESELFGYEKGAYTGASRDGQPGKFELADGGTLFLDEIGDMPFDLQSSLLRVLQSKEILRLGSRRPKAIDVRIIAATNVDLEKAILDNAFRKDLFYRLNAFSIEIPPLRTHPEDILSLVDYFIKKYSTNTKKNIKGIKPRALDLLCKYSWPGNIRELENIVGLAVNICQGSMIDLSDLPQKMRECSLSRDYHIRQYAANHSLDNTATQPNVQIQHIAATTIQEAEYDLIVETLTKTYGNMKKAAEILGIGRRTLFYKTKKYQIDVNEYR